MFFSSYSLTALSIGIVTFCYLLYFSILQSENIKSFFSEKFGNISGQTRLIIFYRLLGFFSFGLLPLLVFILMKRNIQEIGLYISFQFPHFIWILGFSMLSVVVNFFNARSANNLSVYPQIRSLKWDTKLIIVSAISWSLYLLGYEIMMRGYLFFTVFNEIGLVNAIIINTSIYALIHIPKGIKEIFGSIPVGIVLCIITWKTGNIWAAFWIHCSMALTNEWFSLKYNKKIKII